MQQSKSPLELLKRAFSKFIRKASPPTRKLRAPHVRFLQESESFLFERRNHSPMVVLVCGKQLLAAKSSGAIDIVIVKLKLISLKMNS